MLLSDRDIRAQIEAGRIKLDPFDPRLVQPASVDVRLDRWFKVLKPAEYTFSDDYKVATIDVIDPAGDQSGKFDEIEADTFDVVPNGFVLASTVERLTLPDDIAARCEGKSSLGRLGLSIHTTAGFIDPGFDGHVTLEITNTTNYVWRLHAGMKIAQFCFFRMSSPAEHPYGSKQAGSHYQGQRGPTLSRSHEGFYRMEGA